MSEMILSAYAKINWCLDIVGRRENGYHLLDMLMQPISLCDTLIIRESDTISFRTEGATVPDGGDNLVLRAAGKLQSLCEGQGADITLIKRIPSGAGLGGGSADAACALQGLRRFWHLSLSDEALSEIGLSLGADVPFCLYGAPARVRGIGENITGVSGLHPACLLIVKPAGSLSTPSVFREYDQSPENGVSCIDAAIAAMRREEYRSLRQLLQNSLYAPARRLMPAVEDTVAALYQSGALFAAMSGSGSACFGVFENKNSADRAGSALKETLEKTEIFTAETLC